MKPTHKLSIYLIKKGYKSFRDCLRKNPELKLKLYKLKPHLKLNGEIYLAETQTNELRWQELLQQGASKTIPALNNSSNRALLLLKVEGRIFACCFGYGQYLLNQSVIERNFGLRTAVNSVEPDKLRSIDKAKLGELTVQARIQSSVITDRGSFDIDVIGDLLRSITGESIDSTLGGTITGTDAVYLSPKVEFADIPEIMKKLKKSYGMKRYRANFDWIDNLQYEKNPSLIEDLNEALVDALKKKDNMNVSISPPFIMDWTSFSGISFTPKGDLTDFEIDGYYDAKDMVNLSIEKLKSSSLYIENSGNANRVPISVMSCLNFQTEINRTFYVRSLGQWYRVSKTFSDKIYNEVKLIMESDSAFIDCESDWDEKKYNEELAKSNSNYSLFDRKLVRCEGAKNKVEACDVLTKSKELIHVKPKNHSSTLSHLFSQGKISAVALNGDRGFRQDMREIIRSNKDFDVNVIPLEKVNNMDFTITYATITKGDKGMIQQLPFFSIINLRQSAQFLSQHGFDVRIKKIKKKKS